MDNSRFKFISPSDLEDYRDQAADISDVSWPEFMLHDPVANTNWHELFDRFSDYQFALLDTEKNRMAAMGNSLPFHWDHPVQELPEGGWDWVFLKAIEDHKAGVTPNIQSAIQIAIHPEYQSQGLSFIHGASHARDSKVQGIPESGGARQTESKKQISSHQHR